LVVGLVSEAIVQAVSCQARLAHLLSAPPAIGLLVGSRPCRFFGVRPQSSRCSP